jgi:hypothetical protein
MKSRFGLSPSIGDGFRIIAIMPVNEDNSPQYRIRNDEERHERVTTEDGIEELTARPNSG